jgi:uncharacterized protein YukE
VTAPPVAIREADDLSAIIDTVLGGVDQAADLVNGVLTGARSVLALLPPEVVSGVLADLARLERSFDEATAGLGEIVASGGGPPALRAAGSAWATEIGGVAGRLAGLATLDATAADDHWSGDAATAYRNTLPPQQAALTALKTAGDEVDATLVELANAITKFWINLALACASLVAALLASAAGAATVVGAPLSLGACIASIGVFATALTGLINSLTELITDIHKRAHELDRRLANDTAIRGGAWPTSTSVSGDGSITDGDDTDWHLE